MGITDKKKTAKGRFEFRLDKELREEMKIAADLTGRDLSAFIHDAVKWYKQSDQLKSEILKYQRELADKKEAFSSNAGLLAFQVVDKAHGHVTSAAAIVAPKSQVTKRRRNKS